MPFNTLNDEDDQYDYLDNTELFLRSDQRYGETYIQNDRTDPDNEYDDNYCGYIFLNDTELYELYRFLKGKYEGLEA